MPNIAVMLKQEISRLAKKEVRAATDPLRKQVAALKREITELKRQQVEIQRAAAALAKAQRQGAKNVASAADEGAATATRERISAAGIKTLRTRLGLSAEALGTLVGATGQSVYGWERGVHPRKQQLAKLIELRGKGKKEVAKMLESAA